MNARQQPTQVDVAREAGVSRALVSLVMRGQTNVRIDKRDAVLRAVEKLGYRPNGPAQLLASKHTRLLGVLAEDLRNPFAGEVIESAHHEAHRRGYRVLINSGHGNPEHEEHAIETFLQLRVDGLLLISPRIADQQLARLAKIIPVAVVGRDTSRLSIDSILVDELAGGTIATEHLLALGHRRIIHFDAPPELQNWSSINRKRGYEAAMTAAGNDANICTVNFAADGGAPEIKPLFENLQPPTAFFAYNDVAATALERALTALGLRTPGHVSVAGYDNTLLARGASGLTSVDQPRDELGLLAMTTLIGRILGETTMTHTVLEPHVVARTSTAPLQAKD